MDNELPSKLKSVFRYPGGKAKISKHIIQQIARTIPDRETKFTFCDVFVGGGSVFLAVANEYPNASFIVNDLDPHIHAFWEVVSRGPANRTLIRFLERIESCHPNIDEFNTIRASEYTAPLDLAFKGLYLSKTAYSGISMSGPIGGYSQKGDFKIDCRYNAQKIAASVLLIAYTMHGRLVAKKQDFARFLKRHRHDENTVMYLDPSYYEEGSQLYPVFLIPERFEEMRDLLRDASCPWILSHNAHPVILEQYKHWCDVYSIDGVSQTINSEPGKKKTELLITPATGKTKIFLDDQRTPPNGWILTKTVDETIRYLEQGPVSHISLDHDLGDETVVGTGYDVISWIERRTATDSGYVPPEISIHTVNPPARRRMEFALRSILRFVEERD